MIGGLIGSIRRIGIFGGSGVEVEVEVEVEVGDEGVSRSESWDWMDQWVSLCGWKSAAGVVYQQTIVGHVNHFYWPLFCSCSCFVFWWKWEQLRPIPVLQWSIYGGGSFIQPRLFISFSFLFLFCFYCLAAIVEFAAETAVNYRFNSLTRSRSFDCRSDWCP